MTTNTTRYVDLLKNQFCVDLRRKGYILKDTYFQQDNSRVHTANATLDFLRTKFNSNHIISKDLYPARSPDLTPPDFFLFGYIKSKVYANSPTTLEDLKANIRHEMQAVPREMLCRVMNSAVRRMQLCQRVGGGHIQHLL